MVDSKIFEQLRMKYRPKTIKLLLVGESRPVKNTFFYQANSHLFQAVVAAFRRTFGNNVPSGQNFIPYFQKYGGWLYDMADRPVNHLPDSVRRDEIDTGIPGLVSLLKENQPVFVVGVKKNLGKAIQKSADQAGDYKCNIYVLPFPLYQWREVFISQFARLLNDIEKLNG